MREVSPQQYASEQGIAIKTVYDWIKKKKLITRKERVNGREVTVIILQDRNSNVRNKTLEFKGVKQDVNEVNEVTQEVKPIVNNLELVDFMREVTEKITYYAERAGEAKLLEDSEKRTRDEYFRVLQENSQLKLQSETYVNEKENYVKQLGKCDSLLQEKKEQIEDLILERDELQNQLKEVKEKLKDLEAQIAVKHQKKSWIKIPRIKFEYDES